MLWDRRTNRCRAGLLSRPDLREQVEDLTARRPAAATSAASTEHDCNQPVLAAVPGCCFGGGAIVAITCVRVGGSHSYLAAQFRRLAARRGVKRALVAVAHSLQGIIYALLNRQSTYADLGAAYFDQRDRHHTSQRLVARLERLGCRVNLQRAATG